MIMKELQGPSFDTVSLQGSCSSDSYASTTCLRITKQDVFLL